MVKSLSRCGATDLPIFRKSNARAGIGCGDLGWLISEMFTKMIQIQQLRCKSLILHKFLDYLDLCCIMKQEVAVFVSKGIPMTPIDTPNDFGS